MKKCKDCGHDVSDSAKVCPNCGSKLKSSKKAIIISIIVILLIIIAASTGNEGNKAKKSNNSNASTNSNTSTNQTSKKEEQKTVFEQKDIVNLKNVEYSITGVTRSQGKNEYNKPKSGKEYIIINLKIENKSDEKISFNPFDWKLLMSNGEETDSTAYISGVEDSLSSGDLNPGGVKTGTLSYEIPKGDKVALKYYGNIFASKEGFQINIAD